MALCVAYSLKKDMQLIMSIANILNKSCDDLKSLNKCKFISCDITNLLFFNVYKFGININTGICLREL